MEELLKDNNTYKIVKKNPIVNIEKKLNSVIKKWFQLEFISKQSYFYMHLTDSILPKAYGLSKIHKINHPLGISFLYQYCSPSFSIFLTKDHFK